MGEVNISVMQDLLKYVYADEITEGVNNNFPFLKRWKNADSRYRTGDGKAFLIPIRTTRGNSFGGISDGGAIPAYDAPETAQAVVNVRYLAGTYRVTGPAIAASETSKSSVKKAMDFAKNSLLDDINNRASKYLMLDGSGIIAQAGASAVSGATVHLDGAAGHGTFFLEGGEYVAAVTTAGVYRGTYRVLSVDHATQIVTFTTAVAAPLYGTAMQDTDYLVYCRSDANALAKTDYLKVPHGLGFKGGMLDATGSVSYEGLTATAVDKWKPTVVSAAGNPISQDYLDKTYLRTRNKGGVDPNFICANDGMVSEFRGLIEDQRRFNDLKIPLGAKEATYSMFGKDIKVFFDRFVPSGYVAFLDEDAMLTFESRKGSFDSLMGGSTLKFDGTDSVTAVWLWYVTWGTDARNHHGVLTNVSQTNIIAPGGD